MPDTVPFRWIVDGPADGPDNMARDEAVLIGVSEGRVPATLRLYGWSAPTISLGYFQPYSDYAALPPPAGQLPVVRRFTGGGAILHDLEMTYSLTLPLDHPLLAGRGPSGLYEVVHRAFARLLAEAGVRTSGGPQDGGASQRGPFFCFERHGRYDLLIDGAKVLGSAQRRTRTAVLQHGSLILDSRYDQQRCACAARHAEVDLSRRVPRLVEFITGSRAGEPATFGDDERQLAERLRARYDDPAWTRRR